MAQFDASTNGLLAYVPGEGSAANATSCSWIAREALLPSHWAAPTTWPSSLPTAGGSPTEITGANNDIWSYEVASGVLTRLTFEGEN